MNATHILNDNDKGMLTAKNRRELIRHLIEYQTHRFGQNPKQNEKDAISTAAGFLFKMLTPVSKFKNIFCVLISLNCF